LPSAELGTPDEVEHDDRMPAGPSLPSPWQRERIGPARETAMDSKRTTVYAVLLRFSQNANRAGELMSAHGAWIERGIDEGVFLVVGSLQPRLGGAVIAHGITRAELDARLQQDPFVEHGVVTSEVLEISPSRADRRVAFLLG
jgi:uncharacterized protein YciI